MGKPASIAALGLLLCAALGKTARADWGSHVHLLWADAALGLSAPIGGERWTDRADPTFDAQLRGGLGLFGDGGFGAGVEAHFDLLPVHLQPDGSGRLGGAQDGTTTSAFRFRFTFGVRVAYDFERGSVYLHLGVGADHLSGENRVLTDGASRSTPFGATAFTLEPDVGVQLHFRKYGTAGLQVGFPVGFHTLFTAADLDALATIGVRL